MNVKSTQLHQHAKFMTTNKHKDLMDSFDPVHQSIAVTGVKPLLTLAIFAGVGSFFLGALVTAIKRGMREEGWFKFIKEEKEQD